MYALDGKTGALIWEHRSGIEQNISTVCCGWTTAALRSVRQGLLGQLDGYFVALDIGPARRFGGPGSARWQDGYTITAAPLFHNGVVYSGVSGGDRQARGFLAALDAKTGKEKWRFWTVRRPASSAPTPGPGRTPDPSKPMPGNTAAPISGRHRRSIRTRPHLFLYRPTGTAGHWRRRQSCRRQPVTSSIVAVTLEGKDAWHFQQVRHDLWDFDCPSPVILFEQMYEGKMRKGIAEAARQAGSTSSTAPTESR